MKIRLISDLHIDHTPLDISFFDEDVLVIAGDVSENIHSTLNIIKNYLKTNISADIVFILGNHDYYGGTIEDVHDKWSCVNLDRFHYLASSSIVIRGYRFCGATLWTDMKGADKQHIESTISDYHYILDLKVENTIRLHQQELFYLKTDVSKSLEPCIVVTHHLPSFKSIDRKYKDSPVNYAFASDLNSFIEESKILYWFHGHTHSNCDYTIGSTRVICNPRGYSEEENIEFDIGMIIETS